MKSGISHLTSVTDTVRLCRFTLLTCSQGYKHALCTIVTGAAASRASIQQLVRRCPQNQAARLAPRAQDQGTYKKPRGSIQSAPKMSSGMLISKSAATKAVSFNFTRPVAFQQRMFACAYYTIYIHQSAEVQGKLEAKGRG